MVGASAADFDKALAERMTTMRAKFKDLEKDPTLEPKVIEYQLAIRELEKLKVAR